MTPNPISLLKAIAFAARAHQGQFRKDGKTPYVSHPFRVCLILRHVFEISDENILTAAVLHDTIEDTTVDFDDLEEEFGKQIAEWVAQLSKDKRQPYDHREEVYQSVLTEAPWQVQVCKLADIYDNLLDTGGLPEAKRQNGLKNKAAYLDALRSGLKDEAARAFELTEAVLKEM